ncbi:MAG: hypothetical protein P4L33_06530 [Capsulimonadaceae bacterium]|nr:hypothetical protein [Capsulimonadaceae bacterium]
MGLADRVYNIAKGYLDKASQRWDEIDEQARRELDGYVESPELSAWERAQKKVESAQAQGRVQLPRTQEPIRDTLKDLPPGYEPPIPQMSPPSQNSTLDAAYRVLGIAPGSDFAAVRKAYDTLRQRTAALKFEPGSTEFERANRIQRRSTAAYMLLANTLRPEGDRFDRLEI